MATAKYVQNGERIDYANAGSTAIAAGTVVAFGTKIGVAGCDIEAGATGVLFTEGVFEIAKETGAITAGAAVYWDDSNSVITTTSSGNTLAGFAIAAAASDDANCLVKINA